MKTILIVLIIFVCFIIILPVLLSLGGINVLPGGGNGTSKTNGVLIRSADRGAHWEAPTFSGPRTPSGIFDITPHPTNPDILFAATKSSGIWKSADGGANWEPLTDQASILLPTADVYKIAMSRASSTIMYAAVYQANKGRILKSEDGGAHFREVYFVTASRFGVFDIYADPNNVGAVIAATGEGLILRSDDGGRTWRLKHDFGEPITTLAVNPLYQQEMYALTSNERLSKSFDGGETWTGLSFDDSGAVNPGNNGYVYQGPTHYTRPVYFFSPPVTPFVIDPHSPATLYRGIPGKLLRSQNGGFTWNEVGTLFGGSNASTRVPAVDPARAGALLVAAGQELDASNDNGQSWNVSTFPAAAPAKKIFMSPLRPDTIFIILGR